MSSYRRWSKTKTDPADRIATEIAGLSRSQLKGRLLNMRARFRLDFTEDYLNSLSKDELRHVVLAACLNAC